MKHEVTISDEFISQNDFKALFIHRLPIKYSVNVEHFECKNHEKHYWNQCKVHIYENGNEIISFNRNYGAPKAIYVLQNNKEFIVTSADYQCITIVNLTDKTIESYTNEKTYKFGGGFCPISFDWDEDDNTLEIYGCVWACPYGTYYFENIDLSNPTFDWENAKYIDDDYEESDDEDGE